MAGTRGVVGRVGDANPTPWRRPAPEPAHGHAESTEPSTPPVTGPAAPASRRQSLAAALLLLTVGVSIAALATEAAIHAVVDDLRISLPAALLVAVLLGAWGVRQLLHGPLSLLRALAGSVQSFRDQDYSFGVYWPRNDELRELVDAHAALGEVLREQRLNLVQRELLLDSMVQHSPVAMVLRVISHELNNSLAPIASMAHSGAELLRRGRTERLPEVFETIGERAAHLEHVIKGYATFAKLPTPRREAIDWGALCTALHAESPCTLQGTLPQRPLHADRAQLEQALLNLLKNARESGSPPEAITFTVQDLGHAFRIEVADRGPGMSATVLEQALVPFYSTKRSGTGLGLALVREIVEAHGGRIALNNREGGGLLVGLTLPG
jgi:signal transduction histidine kinase